MSACEGGHLDVVKYVCEVGGKELVMARSKVSGTVRVLWEFTNTFYMFLCKCVHRDTRYYTHRDIQIDYYRVHPMYTCTFRVHTRV
jgi:hypothetical protein